MATQAIDFWPEIAGETICDEEHLFEKLSSPPLQTQLAQKPCRQFAHELWAGYPSPTCASAPKRILSVGSGLDPEGVPVET